MKKRKLLYLGNKTSSFGGTKTTLESLSMLLIQEGFVVITASAKKRKWLRLLDMIWTLLKHGRSTSRVLIDTYSTLNFYYAVTIGNLCRLFGIPYIPILHGGNLPDRLTKSKRLSWKLFNGALTNVAPSHYLIDAFASEGYKNLTYIPNTIELKDYPFLLRNSIRPRILWVRAFAEIYNPMMAIKALELLLIDFPDASLCMIGPEKDGSLKSCQQYSESKNLPVTFTGKLSKEEWRARSQSYDVFLNTTNFDNTPVSVMEAMALGLPVISTNVGGIPHLVTHEENGLLIPPNDIPALVATIKKLLGDSNLTGMLSKNARKKVEVFDWKIVKHHWISLLKH